MGREPSPLAEVSHKQFTVVLRGYDRDEVDQFLAQVEDAFQELMERVAERPTPGHVAQWLGDEVTAVLSAAEAAAEKVRAEAEARAEEIRADAEDDVRQTRIDTENARSEVEQARVDARTESEQIRADARAEAEQVRADADEVAADIRLKAQEEGERIVREARLVAERIENAARNQRDQILADAQQGVRDLEAREREVLARIAALEETFGAVRGMVGERSLNESSTEERRLVDLRSAENEAREKSS